MNISNQFIYRLEFIKINKKSDVFPTVYATVRGSRSFGSSDTFVMGLSFKIASASHMTVNKASSVKICWCSTDTNTFLTSLIMLSQAPPWCEANGGLKLHLMLSCSKFFSIDPLFIFAIALFSSFSTPVKFVPLSGRKWDTGPLRHMNRRMALMQESVSRECATSKWIALLAIRVNMTPYCFTWERPCFTSMGPK